ncbi:MAG TPA: helix-turn-helix domain-containing protein [Alphaproteobacteria bacterium]|nr:helix-turn-helix domain-containing protein [Alphaproteobacteria bacterium]
MASLIGLLVEAGGDVGSILELAGIGASVQEFLRYDLIHTPQKKLHQLRGLLTVALARLVAERTGREMLRWPDWQMLFFCLANCRTLREAVERGGDLLMVMNGRCGRMSLVAGPLQAEIRLDSLWSERSTYTLAVDILGLATFIDIFAWLIGQPIPLSRVLLDYPSEMLAKFDPELFAAAAAMNAGRSGIVFPVKYLDYPVVRSTDECEGGMEAILSSMFDLGAESARDRLAERTRRIMLRALRESAAVPSLEEVSKQLGCSKDQFRRWLGRKGISYNHMKESCRRELALDLLRRSSLPIEEISVRVGYWDSDAFRRAVKKWVGLAPSEFRKNTLNGSH